MGNLGVQLGHCYEASRGDETDTYMLIATISGHGEE